MPIICIFLIFGLLFWGYRYQKNIEMQKQEHDMWLAEKYSRQNDALMQSEEYVEYHQYNEINEPNLYVCLYVYNKNVSIEKNISIEDVKKYLASEFNKDGSLRIEKGYEKIKDYIKWYCGPNSNGIAGATIIREVKIELNNIKWNYGDTNPQFNQENTAINYTSIDLSIPQVEELIKKYEDSSYKINDDIMMERE